MPLSLRKGGKLVLNRALGHARGNAMEAMLPLFDALATGAGVARLRAGPGRALRLQIVHTAAAKVAAHA